MRAELVGGAVGQAVVAWASGGVPGRGVDLCGCQSWKRFQDRVLVPAVLFICWLTGKVWHGCGTHICCGVVTQTRSTAK